MGSSSERAEEDTVYRKMKDEIHALKKSLEKHEKLLNVMQKADIWDYTIYDEKPGQDWVALDRQDYEAILEALHHFDHKQPWKENVERRLEG